MKKYFVCYVWGSCSAGDRNGGVSEFETLESAVAEVKEIREQHKDAVCMIIRGEEVGRE